jgi:hypothetical protein
MHELPLKKLFKGQKQVPLTRTAFSPLQVVQFADPSSLQVKQLEWHGRQEPCAMEYWSGRQQAEELNPRTYPDSQVMQTALTSCTWQLITFNKFVLQRPSFIKKGSQ